VTYLVDTHIALWWWLDDAALPARDAEILEESALRSQVVGLSAISLWEIAILVEKGRIRLTGSVDALLEDIERHPAVDVLPLTARVALESTRLGPSFPRDPADRIIAATARCHGLRLMTADERIRDSGVVALA
jgi:PIN domain nuclease of toxin-antitoxin system